MRLGRPAEAIDSYGRCVELDPHRADAWVNAGGLFLELGQPERALACLERGVDLSPEDPIGWYHCARAQRALGHRDDAARSFERVLEFAAQTDRDLASAARLALTELRPSPPERSVPASDRLLDALERSLRPGGQVEQVAGARGRFGYDLSNPVPGDGCNYCARLRCPAGHAFWFHRVGSVGNAPDGHWVDAIQLLCFGGEAHVVLHFDMYHAEGTPLVPDALTITSPAGRGTAHHNRGRHGSFVAAIQADETRYTPPFHSRA